MSLTEPLTRRFTREEYHRMGETGLFLGERVELIGGEIKKMSPKRSAHSVATALTEAVLVRVFGPGFWVRNQEPLAVSSSSEPEPDLCVVCGSPRDYAARHPAQAVLVVEVSEATLRFDREEKAGLYASAGIPEYWILNLAERCLEVRRDPAPAPGAPFDAAYRRVQVLKPPETLAPLETHGAQVAVADLLP